MTTFTEVLAATKSSKHNGLTWTPCPSGTCLCTGKLTIDTDRARVVYALVELPTRWAGRAVRLMKVGAAESYDVFAHESDPRQDRCDCKGFLHTGRCKHAAALRAIAFENKWLADPRANAEADVGNTEVEDQDLPDCFRDCGPFPGNYPF